MLFSSLTAMIVTALFMPITIMLLKKLQIVDVASSRSSHVGEAIRGTGLALILGVTAGGLATILVMHDETIGLLAVITFGVLAGYLGLIEDFSELTVVVRISGQAVLSVALGIALVVIFGTSWIIVPFVTLVGVAFINISNFMDGLNGMSGLHGVITGLSLSVVGYIEDMSWLATGGAILMAVYLTFLPWNLFRKKTFMGDSGSYLLGAIHIGLASAAFVSGIPLLSAFGGTAIYIADTLSTIVMRTLRRDRITESHREHVYQRLNQLGISHVKTSLIVNCFTALSSLAGLLALSTKDGLWIISIIAIFVLCIIYISLPKLISKYGHLTLANDSKGERNHG